MPLSDKTRQWQEEIAASSDVLLDVASVAVARHHLSTAVSRKPQKALWESSKPHLAVMLTSPAGTGILRCLAEFGTPVTIGELTEALLEHKATLLETTDAALVADAVAPRIDEKSGKREALFTALLQGATPAKLAQSAPLRVCVARLGGDATFGATIAKLVSDKAFVQWMTAALCDKKSDEAAITFVERVVTSAASNAATSPVVTGALLQAVKQQLDAQSEHRPRPAVLKVLCSHGFPETLDKLCAALAQWKNLEHVVLAGDNAKAIASLLERAANVAPRTKLATAILKALPTEKLAKHSFGTGKLLLTLRNTGLVQLPSVDLIDAVEDRITCATGSCAEATKVAIRRELERLAQNGSGLGQRRPKLTVVDSDDEEVAAPAKGAASPKGAATAAVTPARKSSRAENGPASASKRSASRKA